MSLLIGRLAHTDATPLLNPELGLYDLRTPFRACLGIGYWYCKSTKQRLSCYVFHIIFSTAGVCLFLSFLLFAGGIAIIGVVAASEFTVLVAAPVNYSLIGNRSGD